MVLGSEPSPESLVVVASEDMNDNGEAADTVTLSELGDSERDVEIMVDSEGEYFLCKGGLPVGSPRPPRGSPPDEEFSITLAAVLMTGKYLPLTSPLSSCFWAFRAETAVLGYGGGGGNCGWERSVGVVRLDVGEGGRAALGP